MQQDQEQGGDEQFPFEARTQDPLEEELFEPLARQMVERSDKVECHVSANAGREGHSHAVTHILLVG